MPKYIDAETVKIFLKRAIFGGDQKIDGWVDAMPAADVAPVVHAKWKATEAYPHNVYCTHCYKIYAQTHWTVWEDGSLPRDFCPKCGARMDGDADA